VRGSTVDAADGAPIGGVDVSFWREGESRPTTSRQANAKGEFAVRSLREGRYRLVTSKQGYGQEVREVDLEPGASAEVVLALSASDGLGLSVVDARDNRPLDATVVVRDLTKRVVANQHSGVGVDGTLTIPLAPGRYLLSTSAGGYGTATVPVTAPARGVRVGLTPGGTLVLESERDLRGRVRLVRPDGEEYVRCWCNGIADIQLTGRHTRVANVTAGSYTVELVDHAGVATRGPTVVIEEGRTATVEIE
ncbi:MAG TPA: carboxypeptidase-like regulatory domain-containing protein, partial [Vicinamibacteria bacterium]|nr:carboxypeptidase-like regulatory domain-containing protein [Vicinamibacteria bacterium]